jgi:Mg-chelatase subunit ChlD
MNDYSEVVVILDRSGSMQSAKSDHEGGLKSFVNDQKQIAGDVRFTLVKFDTQNPCEIVYDGTPMSDVGEITLDPRGGTPLLDAIGLAVSHVENRLSKMNRRPDQVLVMIVTDGYDNASHEWTRDRIKSRIAELEKREWKFLYLGANVDAFAEASSMGISLDSSLGYNANSSQAIRGTYHATSSKMSAARQHINEVKTCGGMLCDADVKAAYSYTDEDRELAVGK